MATPNTAHAANRDQRRLKRECEVFELSKFEPVPKPRLPCVRRKVRYWKEMTKPDARDG